MGRRDAERLRRRQAQGLPFQEPGRDQRAAGFAGARRQARGAAEVRRSAGVRPRRRGNAGAARCRYFLRGGAGRHRGLCRRRRFRAAADAARRVLVDGVHDRPRSARRDAARLGAAGDRWRHRRRLHGPLDRRRRRRAADRGRPVAGHRRRGRRECQPCRQAAVPRHARRPAVAGDAQRSDRPGHDHHRRRSRRRQFRRNPNRWRRRSAPATPYRRPGRTRNEDPHRQPPDRRRGRMVFRRAAAGPRRSSARRSPTTRPARRGSKRSARRLTTTTRSST